MSLNITQIPALCNYAVGIIIQLWKKTGAVTGYNYYFSLVNSTLRLVNRFRLEYNQDFSPDIYDAASQEKYQLL